MACSVRYIWTGMVKCRLRPECADAELGSTENGSTSDQRDVDVSEVIKSRIDRLLSRECN